MIFFFFKKKKGGAIKCHRKNQNLKIMLQAPNQSVATCLQKEKKSWHPGIPRRDQKKRYNGDRVDLTN
jgi:hypothetical protein